MALSFVYFDLGGVLELDFSGTDKWEEMKTELGIKPEDSAAFEAFFSEYDPRLCLDYDIERLVPLIRARFNPNLRSDYSLLKDGFVNRFSPNPSIEPVVSEIAKKYRLGILTNMYRGMFPLIEKRGLIPRAFYEVIVDSSVVGVQKPDPEMYRLAAELAHVPPREILFIDNSKSHLPEASEVGFQTYWYDSATPEKSSKELREYILSLSK